MPSLDNAFGLRPMLAVPTPGTAFGLGAKTFSFAVGACLFGLLEGAVEVQVIPEVRRLCTAGVHLLVLYYRGRTP